MNRLEVFQKHDELKARLWELAEVGYKVNHFLRTAKRGVESIYLRTAADLSRVERLAGLHFKSIDIPEAVRASLTEYQLAFLNSRLRSPRNAS